MEKQLTAVERLEIRMAKHYDFDDLDRYLFNQAKEMEKEQIINAYYYDPNCDDIKDDGEQYYNETFKSE